MFSPNLVGETILCISGAQTSPYGPLFRFIGDLLPTIPAHVVVYVLSLVAPKAERGAHSASHENSVPPDDHSGSPSVTGCGLESFLACQVVAAVGSSPVVDSPWNISLSSGSTKAGAECETSTVAHPLPSPPLKIYSS